MKVSFISFYFGDVLGCSAVCSCGVLALKSLSGRRCGTVQTGPPWYLSHCG